MVKWVFAIGEGLVALSVLALSSRFDGLAAITGGIPACTTFSTRSVESF